MCSPVAKEARITVINIPMQALMHEELASYVKDSVRSFMEITNSIADI